MLRSICEGYAPCFIIALLGYSAIGGSLLGWLSFIWIFGAITTVMIAYARARADLPGMGSQSMEMEKC